MPFVNVGERTNVTGSAPLPQADRRRTITTRRWTSRASRSRAARRCIDVNMDEGMLDSEAAMVHLPQSDRGRARHLPRAGHDRFLEMARDRGRAEMRAGQGGRQLDQHEGGRGALPRARAKIVRRYGAAVVVMAFDEQGQADTAERKIEICQRAYRLLTEQVGFPPEDIIFDPNIFAVATGIEEHND